MRMPFPIVLEYIVRPACRALGARMGGPEAELMLLAIGLQESDFMSRHQIKGPAMGLWQFEQTGVAGVLRHKACRPLAVNWVSNLLYPLDSYGIHMALQDNDFLAAIFARLLLYSDAAPLPAVGDTAAAWDYYLRLWKPGKPRPSDWSESYALALAALKPT